MSNTVEEPQIQVLTKLLTVIEYANNDARVELIQECFENLKQEEISIAVQKLLVETGQRMLNESETLSKGELSETEIMLNLGSLYDEIVFEVSIYLDQNSNTIYNCSFGRQTNPELKRWVCFKHASDVLFFLSQNFDSQQLVQE